MERRTFLRSLVGGMLVAQQLDIEKLLWVPGAKTVFLPPAPPDNSSIWLVSWGERAAQVLFFGDTTLWPEDFTGLAPLTTAKWEARLARDARLPNIIGLLQQESS